jgi:hypothetical protein
LTFNDLTGVSMHGGLHEQIEFGHEQTALIGERQVVKD